CAKILKERENSISDVLLDILKNADSLDLLSGVASARPIIKRIRRTDLATQLASAVENWEPMIVEADFDPAPLSYIGLIPAHDAMSNDTHKWTRWIAP